MIGLPPRLNLTVRILLALLVCGACSGPTAPSGVETTAVSDRVAGAWMLVGQQASGQSDVSPPAGTLFRLEIVNQRAAITADCNRCNGPVTFGGSMVTIGPLLACTRAFCTASSPFDEAFLRILAGESEAAVDASTLTLRSARGVLRFRK